MNIGKHFQLHFLPVLQLNDPHIAHETILKISSFRKIKLQKTLSNVGISTSNRQSHSTIDILDTCEVNNTFHSNLHCVGDQHRISRVHYIGYMPNTYPFFINTFRKFFPYHLHRHEPEGMDSNGGFKQ